MGKCNSSIYPRSWYPLCRSSDLKAGALTTCEALNRRLVVFRSSNGDIGAMDAQCSHIGADLGQGWVKDSHVVCPLHHWEFDTKGECVHIPCQRHIPKKAKQASLKCEEHYEQVFAYLGDELEFSFPEFPGMENSVQSKPLTIDFDAPYEMASVNSFDEQHLGTVHRRRVINGQKVTSDSSTHFKIEYEAMVEGDTPYDRFLKLIGKDEVHMSLDCWGGNIMYFKHLGTSNQMLISLLPLSANRSRAFITTVMGTNNTTLDKVFKRASAKLLNIFTMMFVKQDVRALQKIDFKMMNLLPEADANMAKFYQHWKQLPRDI